MKLTSSQFTNNSNLPVKFTCDGEGINPPLTISDIPRNTKAMALIVDDPDAPSGDYVHWLITDFNPVTKINEGSIPSGAIEGRNSSGSLNYIAPCPPSGTHRYHFKIYALKEKLNLDEGYSKSDFEKAIQNKYIDKALLIGLFERSL